VRFQNLRADPITGDGSVFRELDVLGTPEAERVSAVLVHRADITTPGDSILATSANFPGGEAPANAIDNKPGTKYLNFDELNTGFTVFPNSGLSIVNGLTLTSANDAPERDPVDFVLEGSNDGGVTFTQVATGNVPAFTARFQKVAIDFDNSERFGNYRLTFPNVANASGANSMQIAEVEIVSSDILMDVTRPGDMITASSTNSPGNEGVANAIDDNPATKYLNFDEQNTGFTVTPSVGATIVQGLGLRSANDAAERDPASFILEGSNDGSMFDLIFAGDVPLFPDTGTDGPDRFFEMNFGFDNDTSYLHYRLTFPDVQNPGGANSMQIGEVQLLGIALADVAIPEPGTAALLGLAGLALLRRRRAAA
jgi:hypothetical protein